jgi:hypothetical protein
LFSLSDSQEKVMSTRNTHSVRTTHLVQQEQKQLGAPVTVSDHPTETGPQSHDTPRQPAKNTGKMVTAGEWLRAVTGSNAPFGFDRMPTVWG